MPGPKKERKVSFPWGFLGTDMTAAERSILMGVCSFAWNRGDQCWASPETIGERVNMKRSAAYEAIGFCVAKGFLIKEPRKKSKPGRKKKGATSGEMTAYRIPDRWWFEDNISDGRAGSAEASGHPESRTEAIDPIRDSGRTNPEIRTEAVRNSGLEVDPSELDPLKQSSSSSGTFGSLDTQNQDIEAALEIGLAMFGGPSVETNIRKAAETHGADQVRLALLEARALKDAGRPVQWRYVLGILGNWLKEGGPTPIAQTAVRPSKEELQRRKAAEKRQADELRKKAEMHRQDVEAVRQYRERPESYEGNVRDMQSLVRSMTRLGINESDRQAFERATAKLAELQTAEEERNARELELRTKEHKETLAAYDSDREAYWNDRSKLGRVWDAMVALGEGDRTTVQTRFMELTLRPKRPSRATDQPMPATNGPSRGPVPLTETIGEIGKRFAVGGEPASVASGGATEGQRLDGAEA